LVQKAQTHADIGCSTVLACPPAVAECDEQQIEKQNFSAEGMWGPAGVLSSGIDQA